MNAARKEESPFANVYQIGVIVKDMDEAVKYYEALGIGPFEARKGPPPIDRLVYGKPAPDVKLRVTIAQAGGVEFELIQPIAGESVQKEFLEKHGEGINHLGFLVDDLEREVAKLVEKGFRVTSSGKTPGGGGFAYVDTDKVGGVVFELIQLPPSTR